MPKQQNHPWDDKYFSKGANKMIDPELLAQRKEGEYYDAENMRPDGMDKDLGRISKIKGEELLYNVGDTSCGRYYTVTNQQPAFYTAKWKCLYVTDILIQGEKRVLEMWADGKENPVDPLIRIDGKIVCASSRLPLHYTDLIQLSKNNSQYAAEIFFTNNIDMPLVLDVYDMLRNSGETLNGVSGECSKKYFQNFDVSLYSIQLQTYNHRPMFRGLTTATTGVDKVFTPPSGPPGMVVGQYAYRIRYSNEAGDKTRMSLCSQMCPVISHVDQRSDHYPGNRSYGDSVGSKTGLGVSMWVRIENIYDYEYLDVIRYDYEPNLAGGHVPSPIIAGRIALKPQEYSVKTFIDCGGDEGVLTTDEIVEENKSIRTCKSIRYCNDIVHLFNVEVSSLKIEEDVFLNDGEVFPVVKNIGTVGHSDPFNHAYYRSYMGGEKYSFAVVFFDSSFSNSFAIPIPNTEQYQFPNRREKASPKSKLYSYDNMPVAFNTEGYASEVFEKFDTEHCIEKTFSGDGFFVRINEKGTNGGHELLPLTPIRQTENDVDGHTYVINDTVDVGDSMVSYNPRGFGPDYFSLGLALKGIDMSKLPSWVTSFAIVRTEPANRVICQGLGHPVISSHEDSIYKELNKLWFYAPDMMSDYGHIDPNTVNIQIHKAQFVSPLGFFSEVYLGEHSEYFSPMQGASEDWLDMVVYARIIKDNGQFNIYSSAVGINDYVTWGKWRNTVNPGWVVNDKPSNSGIMDMSGFNSTISGNEGRGHYFDLEISGGNVYSTDVNTGAKTNYNQNAMKQFHEPLHIINIVNENAQVHHGNITNYYDTGTYIKVKSCIGKFSKDQLEYHLVDERWEDCIPIVTPKYGSNAQSNQLIQRNSFIYIEGESGIYTWMNVSYKSPEIIEQIYNTIQQDGFCQYSDKEIYGMYTHGERAYDQYSIKFDVVVKGVSVLPTEGEKIWIYYDNTMPIRIFGGDTYVAETIWCPIDKEKSHRNQEGTFTFAGGWPYDKWHINDNIIITNKGNYVGNVVQDNNTIKTKRIRQMVNLFTVEMRNQGSVAYESESCRFFPSTNYIYRPLNWVIDNLNHNYYDYNPTIGPRGTISAEYKDVYPDEDLLWGYGGFRFLPAYNQDYRHTNNITPYPTEPEVGYEEKKRFHNRIWYSLQRKVNATDLASIRTFYPANIYDISDFTGEIKYGWAGFSDKGHNLYALTDTGIFVILTGKNVLAQADGTELATMIGTQGQYLTQSVPISSDIGVPQEWWRSIAEVSDGLFFANPQGVYLLANNNLKEISRQGYYPEVCTEFLSKSYMQNYITGVFNQKHNEYWLQVETFETEGETEITNEKVLVFMVGNNAWAGKFTHRYDKYVSFDNRIIGCGNHSPATINRLITDELDTGYDIGRQPIVSWVKNVAAPDQGYPSKSIRSIWPKEFIRIQIASNVKPDLVEFYDMDGQQVQAMLSPDISEYYLKNYINFEQYIPRRLSSADAERKRMQGRMLFYKLTHTGGEFFVRQVGIQYKDLK